MSFNVNVLSGIAEIAVPAETAAPRLPPFLFIQNFRTGTIPLERGKGMIVAMSRRIAAALYRELVALNPDWHHDDLDKGAVKVVMTAASSDGPELARHHTNKTQRRALAERMRKPDDPLKLLLSGTCG